MASRYAEDLPDKPPIEDIPADAEVAKEPVPEPEEVPEDEFMDPDEADNDDTVDNEEPHEEPHSDLPKGGRAEDYDDDGEESEEERERQMPGDVLKEADDAEEETP